MISAMTRLSDRRIATVFSLVLASGLCLGLLVVRHLHSGGDGYRFLAWNLFLAWVPFLLALVLYDSDRHRRPWPFLALVAVLWLLFLPNAPYIVTDFVHIGAIAGAPLWFDAGMTAAFAGTGLVLGLGSLLLVQGVVARRFGAVAGWLMIGPALALCSAGIVLGRVHRLNSWDALTSPGDLLHLVAARLADPVGRPESVVVLGGLTGCLATAYLVLYTLSSLGPERDDEPRARAR
jgi:uncharacterized membrane protein